MTDPGAPSARLKILVVAAVILTTHPGCLPRAQMGFISVGDKAALGAKSPFQSAKAVIRSSCAGCHGEWTNYSQQDFISAGLIVPGDPSHSKIPMMVLGGSGWDGEPPSMPEGLSSFPSEKYQALYNWVLTATPGNGGPFECSNSPSSKAAPLRRLSRTQLVNSIRSLLTDSDKGNLTPAQLAEIWGGTYSGITPALMQIPEDSGAHTPEAADQSISTSHVEGWYALADAVADHALRNGRSEQFIRAFAGKNLDGTQNSCAAGSLPSPLAYTSNTCVSRFIERFGLFTHKRPLKPSELQEWQAMYSASPSFRELITLMLAQPRFLMHLEDSNSQPGVVTSLDGFEVAARLSYTYWQTLPDQALLSAAVDGSLETASGFEAQLARVLADPRAEIGFGQFFVDWLGLREKFEDRYFGVWAPFFNQISGFGAFSTSANNQIRAWKNSAVQEARDFFVYHGLKTGGRYSDLLTSRTTFARNADLARITETALWSGDWSTPVLASPAHERSGLLSLTAWLVHGQKDFHRPIMRGVRTRERLLCETFVFPPSNESPEGGPAILQTDSTRVQTSKLTEVAGSSCVQCHSNRINPTGFAYEMFGVAGEPRTQEMRPLEQNGTSSIISVAISAQSEVTIGSTTRSINGLPDLAGVILESGVGERCMVEMATSFWTQSKFDRSADACSANQLHYRLTNSQDGSVFGMMRGMALSPEFRQRSTAQ